VVRRAGLVAIRKHGANAKKVDAADFAEALKDSRATVTPEMEAEYAKIKGELKQRVNEVNLTPIGFVAPGMVSSTRDKKHGS
jgi:transitional endoplasmic reticulum ATPase